MTFPNPNRGDPPICDETNLPSHASFASYRQWHDRFTPAADLKFFRSCPHCGGFHAYSKMRPPSGASSGSSKR